MNTKIDFNQAIDIETPIEIMDDETFVQHKEEGDGNPTPEQDNDFIEVEDSRDTPHPNDLNSSQNKALHLLAKALVEEGVISELEEDVDNVDAKYILNMIQNELSREISGYKDSLPKEIKDLIDNYEEGVPLSQIIDAKSKKIEYSSITQKQLLADTRLQEKIIREGLTEKGFTEERINKYIKRLTDLDDMEDESLSMLEEAKIKAKEKEDLIIKQAKENIKTAEESRQRQFDMLKDDVFKTAEIIPGISINKKDQETIFKSMTEVVDQDSNNNPLNAVMRTRAKNPLAFEKAVHYYHSLGLFNIDENGRFTPDFSKVNRVSKARAIDELTTTLENKKPLASGQPTREQYSAGKDNGQLNALKELLGRSSFGK